MGKVNNRRKKRLRGKSTKLQQKREDIQEEEEGVAGLRLPPCWRTVCACAGALRVCVCVCLAKRFAEPSLRQSGRVAAIE